MYSSCKSPRYDWEVESAKGEFLGLPQQILSQEEEHLLKKLRSQVTQKLEVS